MKGLNPAPHSHFSLPSSLPCPVELIWQRGGSISQFTQAACSFFCAVASFAYFACVSTPIHLSLLCLCASLLMFVCNCFLLQALGGGIISCTVKVKDCPTPEAGNTCQMQAVQLRCHNTGSITYLGLFLLCSLSQASTFIVP